MKGILTKATITRRRILQKAFQAIYHHGYQSTSIDTILKEVDVTKGAFYYHFKNKKEMGIAVIKDVIYPKINQNLILPLKRVEDPIEGIVELFQNKLENLPELEIMLGCPLHNLMIEMGGVDEDFATAISEIILQWEEALTSVIQNGMDQKVFNRSCQASSMVNFMIAGYQGIRSRLKIQFDLDLVDQFLQETEYYLESKRA